MVDVVLYRPVGEYELRLIEASGFTAFPPRLPEQPIFYPVTDEAYAMQIARDWNTKSASRRGYAHLVGSIEVIASFTPDTASSET